MNNTYKSHRKPVRKQKKNPNRMFFDPLVYALDLIKKHFDGKAMLTHNKHGQRVVKYRHVTGSRIVLGYRDNSRLVYDFKFAEFTEEQAELMCQELGQVK